MTQRGSGRGNGPTLDDQVFGPDSDDEELVKLPDKARFASYVVVVPVMMGLLLASFGLGACGFTQPYREFSLSWLNQYIILLTFAVGNVAYAVRHDKPLWGTVSVIGFILVFVAAGAQIPIPGAGFIFSGSFLLLLLIAVVAAGLVWFLRRTRAQQEKARRELFS